MARLTPYYLSIELRLGRVMSSPAFRPCQTKPCVVILRVSTEHFAVVPCREPVALSVVGGTSDDATRPDVIRIEVETRISLECIGVGRNDPLEPSVVSNTGHSVIIEMKGSVGGPVPIR